MAEKSLSHSLLSLITAKPSLDLDSTGEEDSTPTKGVVNDEGAWCWRDGCKGYSAGSDLVTQLTYIIIDCLKATKAIQKVSGALQSIARLYDDNVSVLRRCRFGYARMISLQSRRTMLATHQSLKSLAHPHMVYQVISPCQRSMLQWPLMRGLVQGIIEIHRATATRCAEAVQNEVFILPEL